MALSYPLYDHLVKKVEARTEKNMDIDIRRICATINNIARTLNPVDCADHYKEIYMLILYHEIINNKGMLLSPTPFDPKIMDGHRGILMCIMNLPPQLQQIIAQYIFEYSEQ